MENDERVTRSLTGWALGLVVGVGLCAIQGSAMAQAVGETPLEDAPLGGEPDTVDAPLEPSIGPTEVPPVVSATSKEVTFGVVELAGALALTAPQSDLFGPGGSLGVGVYRSLSPWILLGVHLQGGALLNGDSPTETGVEDPSLGGFFSAQGGVRLRLPMGDMEASRFQGLFLEGLAGAVVTGDLVRLGVQAGLGYGFVLPGLGQGDMGIAPVVRWYQVRGDQSSLDPRDAKILTVGVQLAFGDGRPTPVVIPEVVAPSDPEPEPEAKDTDQDGIDDSEDECVLIPEDMDDFEDTDGCPEPDNDRDGIFDGDDACPVDAEDSDGFEDEDGCPDTDNDGDGVVDALDQCPNEPEVINGNDDEDGCPDEGLIELIDDRIVLDSRVIFRTESAGIRGRAMPVLRALYRLQQQHPEWTHVRIEGHTDYRGNEKFNQRLSELRAQNVVNALVELGVPSHILEAVGFGESRPLNLGGSESSLRVNRRVEFVVISKKEQAVKSEVVAPEGGSASDDDREALADGVSDVASGETVSGNAESNGVDAVGDMGSPDDVGSSDDADGAVVPADQGTPESDPREGERSGELSSPESDVSDSPTTEDDGWSENFAEDEGAPGVAPAAPATPVQGAEDDFDSDEFEEDL